MIRIFAVALLFSATCSCITRGRNFATDFDWIRKKQTTQKKTQQLLGEPFKVGNSSGRATWTYGYYKFSLFGKNYTKELKLYWTPENKIEDFSFSSSFPEDKKKVMSKK